MDKFKFKLNGEATIAASGETGVVVGRAEYVNSESGYLLRYSNKEGVAVEKWWKESALHEKGGD